MKNIAVMIATIFKLINLCFKQIFFKCIPLLLALIIRIDVCRRDAFNNDLSKLMMLYRYTFILVYALYTNGEFHILTTFNMGISWFWTQISRNCSKNASFNECHDSSVRSKLARVFIVYYYKVSELIYKHHKKPALH